MTELEFNLKEIEELKKSFVEHNRYLITQIYNSIFEAVSIMVNNRIKKDIELRTRMSVDAYVDVNEKDLIDSSCNHIIGEIKHKLSHVVGSDLFTKTELKKFIKNIIKEEVKEFIKSEIKKLAIKNAFVKLKKKK